MQLQNIFFIGVRSLFTLFVGLQALDYLSTMLALDTGHAEEKNELLVSLAALSSTTIGTSILITKLLIIGLMTWAVSRAQDSVFDRALLTIGTAYYGMVCAQNLYWAYVLS